MSKNIDLFLQTALGEIYALFLAYMRREIKSEGRTGGASAREKTAIKDQIIGLVDNVLKKCIQDITSIGFQIIFIIYENAPNCYIFRFLENAP